MAGYDWSAGMSNRAVEAYENGEMPLSKWNKKNLLVEVKDFYLFRIEGDNWDEKECEKCLKLLASYPINFLKTEILYKSSWHHTSSQFNCTDFYDVDRDMLTILYRAFEKNKEYLERQYQKFLEEKAKLKEKANAGEDRRIIKYALWGGSLNRPKFLGYEEEEAIIRGNSAYPVNAKTFKDGKKRKLLTGSYVETIKYL